MSHLSNKFPVQEWELSGVTPSVNKTKNTIQVPTKNSMSLLCEIAPPCCKYLHRSSNGNVTS